MHCAPAMWHKINIIQEKLDGKYSEIVQFPAKVKFWGMYYVGL